MIDREGQTTLYFAAHLGRASVVRFLLNRGTETNAMGDAGRKLLNAARSNAEITPMLRAAIPNAPAEASPLRQAGQCPTTAELIKNTSDVSLVFPPNTADNSVTGPILRWMKSVK